MYACSSCDTKLAFDTPGADGGLVLRWQCGCYAKGAHIVAQATSKLAGVGGIKS